MHTSAFLKQYKTSFRLYFVFTRLRNALLNHLSVCFIEVFRKVSLNWHKLSVLREVAMKYLIPCREENIAIAHAYCRDMVVIVYNRKHLHTIICLSQANIQALQDISYLVQSSRFKL